MSDNIQTAYDQTPYQSYPYVQSSIAKLATLGTLFGMIPPQIHTARVLELGCASGGNIIPQAVHYPQGDYIGVDLSNVQITSGNKQIIEMELPNIKLKHCSILDIDDSFGKFDYIICHGVFSWVPECIQNKILEVCNKNLNKNGIAYISYNTLPGWNIVRTIRDMMIYHTKSFAQDEKVAQSRALLEFIKNGAEVSNSIYAKILKQEAEVISLQEDQYIRHEYLEENNKQFYFSEFIRQANQQGLQYLSDCSLSSMYIGNMTRLVSEQLQKINDIVRTEQYMDFITNRRFRNTLLCHSEIKLNRSLNNHSIKNFAVSLDIDTQQNLTNVMLENNQPIKFYFKGDKEHVITTTSPSLKAIFYVLIENKGYPMRLKNLIIQASKLIVAANSKDVIKNELLNNSMNLVIKGYMDIHIQERDKSKIQLCKPKVSTLVRYQVTKTLNNWVTSPLHKPVVISVFDKLAIQYMDGYHTTEQIIDKLIIASDQDAIIFNKNGNNIENRIQIHKKISTYLQDTISRCTTQGLFQ